MELIVALAPSIDVAPVALVDFWNASASGIAGKAALYRKPSIGYYDAAHGMVELVVICGLADDLTDPGVCRILRSMVALAGGRKRTSTVPLATTARQRVFLIAPNDERNSHE